MMGASPAKQQGFSIAMAIFVLVILAMLGAAMARIVAQGQESVAREVVSIRALMAAESGAERGLQAVLSGASACGGDLSNPPTSYAALGFSQWSMSGDGLAGCSADVSCGETLADNNQDGTDTPHYTIRSIGSCGPSGSQAVRIVEVQAR